MMSSRTDEDSDHRTRSHTKRKSISVWEALDHWVILQLLAVFSFSFAVGILFMHGTILWHQYKHGYTIISNSPLLMGRSSSGISIEKLPKNVKNDIFEWSQGQLRVNTSIYVR
ncbi:hypothetical protein LSH36_104g04000 [Paralvinella palmiformis]|uniref:Uncharacterized protein n=1 Tax=Paralvinella palmiformis TaxID=53620 RepID=A0AAD9JZ06_9ANNE|nr:hypothetical protein LSH36_104g04000 [Paralvinella palmiformis]